MLLAWVLVSYLVQSSEASQDHYKILGVARNATEQEIVKAFRKLSIKWHPDKNTSPRATEKFQKISLAYETLSRPERRRNYDLQRPDVDFSFADGGEAFIASLKAMMPEVLERLFPLENITVAELTCNALQLHLSASNVLARGLASGTYGSTDAWKAASNSTAHWLHAHACAPRRSDRQAAPSILFWLTLSGLLLLGSLYLRIAVIAAYVSIIVIVAPRHEFDGQLAALLALPQAQSLLAPVHTAAGLLVTAFFCWCGVLLGRTMWSASVWTGMSIIIGLGGMLPLAGLAFLALVMINLFGGFFWLGLIVGVAAVPALRMRLLRSLKFALLGWIKMLDILQGQVGSTWTVRSDGFGTTRRNSAGAAAAPAAHDPFTRWVLLIGDVLAVRLPRWVLFVVGASARLAVVALMSVVLLEAWWPHLMDTRVPWPSWSVSEWGGVKQEFNTGGQAQDRQWF